MPILGASQTIPPWLVSVQLWHLAVRGVVIQPWAIRDLALQSQALFISIVEEDVLEPSRKHPLRVQ